MLAARRVPVRGAVVRSAGVGSRTNRRGFATLSLPESLEGVFRVVARKRGFKRATAVVSPSK